MSEIVKKEVCKCENCGNEAEMVVTCSLPDVESEDGAAAARNYPGGRRSGENDRTPVGLRGRGERRPAGQAIGAAICRSTPPGRSYGRPSRTPLYPRPIEVPRRRR